MAANLRGRIHVGFEFSFLARHALLSTNMQSVDSEMKQWARSCMYTVPLRCLQYNLTSQACHAVRYTYIISHEIRSCAVTVSYSCVSFHVQPIAQFPNEKYYTVSVN